jgi:dienelactone hydrolase
MSLLAALHRLLLVLALTAGGARAEVGMQTLPLPLGDRATLFDLYSPEATPSGIAIVAHGFTRTRDRQAVLARRLAEAGLLVAVPDLPYWSRHEANADAVVALAEAVQALPGNGGLPIVLVGTSAGGLATLLAAERVSPLALWVGLDPVDAFRISKSAAGRLQAPALVLRAKAGACNVGGSARRIAGWLPEGRIEQRIDGASHCDFENPTDSRCETICGDADPARQEQVVQITVDAARRAVAGHGAPAPLSAPRP